MSLRPNHIFTTKVVLLFLLILASIVQLDRVLAHLDWATSDLTGRNVTTPSAKTKALLKTFPGKISFTYFVTPTHQMPPHLKGVVAPVSSLLNALQNLAPDKISYRILDPDISNEIGHNYAARKKVSPFSVRAIKQDEHSERDVWSSLVIAPEGHTEILIQKITPSDLPYLQDLIHTHLTALSTPPKPIIAIASPNYVTLFSKFAEQYGQIRHVDLTHVDSFPHDADLLFWLQPQEITPSHVQALNRFLDAGKTVILGGSSYVIDYATNQTNQIVYQAFPTGQGWQNLLAPLGISPQPDLLMDTSQGPIFFRDNQGKVRQAEAPFHLRVMPGFYNLKGFLAHARGALNFVAASPLEVDTRKIHDAGYSLDILATTTEKAYVQALPPNQFDNQALKKDLPVGKQNLMVRLHPHNPWQGEMLILATASPFRDGIFNQPNYGHRVFLQTVLRTFTERSRIVKSRVAKPAPPALPELSSGSRFFWRFWVVFVIPIFVLAIGLGRYVKQTNQRLMLGNPRALTSGVLAVLGLLLCSYLWSKQTGWFLDLTAESIHSPKAFTRAQLSGKTLKADLIIPSRATLPSHLKHIEHRSLNHLNALGIPTTIRRPEALSNQDKARLQAAGLQPFEVQRVQDDQQISQWIQSGLLLHKPGKVAVVPRLNHRTIDHFEFHLITAQAQLDQGKTPHIALISEPPRLSPAEAFEYHQQQLTPPKGADVFSGIQMLLRTYGYRVTYVDPREPIMPDNIDALIWMQPRRDATQTTQLVSNYLAGGGKVLVALQHFNIQQRQYRGAGFETVYWPQPQYQDFNPYLEHLGLHQVREVLMDQTKSRLSLETQINRAAVREYEAQEVTLPFLIRAVGPNFEPTSPITKHLGDQLFIWGNRFVTQTDSLSKYNITTMNLINTSDKAWSYNWQGGWMPEAVFSSSDSTTVGQSPLAILATGTFPQMTLSQNDSGQTVHHLAHHPKRNEGALMLLGSSEMFKDTYLYAPGFQHDQLLLNAVAFLTWGKDHTEIQARRKIARGFPHQPTSQKVFWRVVVVCTGASLFVFYGFLRTIKQRTSTP